MGNPVMWFELLVEDADKANTFYEKLFDWKIDRNNPKKYGFVNTGSDKGIHGGIGHPSMTGEKKILMYVEVEDLDQYLQEAVALGGKVIMPSQEVDGYPIAIFEDPCGHQIGLIKNQNK
jgi:predicted enzyme related to lactoylglutathione lyase